MSDLSIEKIDKNFRVETTLQEEDIRFYDVRQDPFTLYGLYDPRTPGDFCRLPDDVAAATSTMVRRLARHTAGGRVRFATDSAYVAIRMTTPGFSHRAHMTLTATVGFDLYLDEGGRSTYVGTFVPPVNLADGYESIIRLGSRKMRQFTIHFPLYGMVSALYVGLQQDAAVARGAEYRCQKPVVYYGSSITQGGCASRPGTCYPNLISAKLGCDHLNLGFSGSARGEDAIADYMAGLDFSVFVCDYDHNAPTVEHLAATHERLFLKIRDAHPDTPVVLVSRPDFDKNVPDSIRRREVIYATYQKALARGDKNVVFIDGERLFKDDYRDACTVDGIHPNDAGFVRMAEVIGFELDRLLRRSRA